MSSWTTEVLAPSRGRVRFRPVVRAPRSAMLPGAAGGRFYLVLATAALAIAALSLLIPSTPSYDPWAWLEWGREIVHLRLHTTAGPSFKPLPVIFTTLFAPLGGAAPDAWLVVARAGAVMATVMCFRVAWRLTRRLTDDTRRLPDDARRLPRDTRRLPRDVRRLPRDVRRTPAWRPLDDARRLPRDATEVSARIRQKARWHRVPTGLLLPLLAALIAAGSFVNSPNVLTENALGYSEGFTTALVLIALERHLDGARRQAFVIGFFASLDRPELWLIWVPYGIALTRRDPAARTLVLWLLALAPVLWFGPELWGSGHLLRGVTRAQSPRSNSAAYAGCPFCTELTRHALRLLTPRVEIAAAVATGTAAVALLRQHRRSGAAPGLIELLALGVFGSGWWVGVAVETQAGFSGNDRYLVLGSALVGIAGGVGWAWGAHGLAGLLRGRWAWGAHGLAGLLRGRWALSPRGLAKLRRRWALPVAVLAAVAALVAIPPPLFRKGMVSIPATHGALVYQAHLREDLFKAVHELGGPARILRCGTVMTEGFQVPMVAYALGVRTVQVEAPPPSIARPGPAPNVIFQTRATRRSYLLPVVEAWRGVHYRLAAQVRTFTVYSSCRGRVSL